MGFKYLFSEPILLDPKFKIECERFYGQPKLIKTKDCNNKNKIGSVDFIPQKCKSTLWVNEKERVFVLHRDWFSVAISRDEAIERNLLSKPAREKFIYRDNWGSVVLRNEAVFSFDFPDLEIFPPKNTAHLTECFFAHLKNSGRTDEDVWPSVFMEWERYFERILRCLTGTERKESL